AVLAERLSAAKATVISLAQERGDLEAGTASVQRQLRVLEAEVEERISEMAGLQVEANDVSHKLAALDAQLAEAHTSHSTLVTRHSSLVARQSDLASRLESVQHNRAEQERAASEAESAVSALRERLSATESLVDERHRALQDAQQAVAQAEREQQAAAGALN